MTEIYDDRFLRLVAGHDEPLGSGERALLSFPETARRLAAELKARDALYPIISASFAGSMTGGDLHRLTGMKVNQISPVARVVQA